MFKRVFVLTWWKEKIYRPTIAGTPSTTIRMSLMCHRKKTLEIVKAERV